MLLKSRAAVRDPVGGAPGSRCPLPTALVTTALSVASQVLFLVPGVQQPVGLGHAGLFPYTEEHSMTLL